MQFLKALGHGSWNEGLENRLVFLSPLWLLTLARSFSFPELQTLAALSMHTSTICLDWFALSWVLFSGQAVSR